MFQRLLAIPALGRPAFASCVAGLLMSYHASLPSGPAIVLAAGAAYLVSILAGPRGVLRSRMRHHRHRTA